MPCGCNLVKDYTGQPLGRPQLKGRIPSKTVGGETVGQMAPTNLQERGNEMDHLMYQATLRDDDQQRLAMLVKKDNQMFKQRPQQLILQSLL